MPTFDSLSQAPVVWTLLVLAAIFVGLSKGGMPGVGMLSVPVLSLVISPVNAAVLLLPIYILSDTVAIWLYRRDFSASNLKVLMPAGFLGVVVGWATASLVSDVVVSFLIGVMGIVFCLNLWLRRREHIAPVKASMPRGIFWGALSGFTSFISHAGAPPYQVYVLPQKLPKMVFAGTTAILFAAINLAKVIPYSSLHPYSGATLALAMVLLPAALVGTVAGRFIINYLPEARFFLLVQIALFVICVRLVYAAVAV